MRLRRTNKRSDENASLGQPTPEVKGKAAQTRQSRCVGETPGRQSTVLREKTNLEANQSGSTRRGVVSETPVGKNSCGIEEASKGSPKRRRSVKSSSPKQTGGRRLCVYTNAATQSCVSDKESIYEFEVDGSEPPSRRRRRRRKATAGVVRGKKRAFPRLPRVRYPSRSETTASSVESVSALSSFEWGRVGVGCGVVKGGEVTPSDTTAATAPPMASTPIVVGRGRLSTVFESPPEDVADSPQMPSDKVIAVVTSEVKASSGEGGVGLAHSTTMPTKVSTMESTAGRQHDEPSLGASMLSNGNASFFLASANCHSTPVKARSGSESSSFAHSRVECATAEKCFGFSSDEDCDLTEGEEGLPSPVRASPRMQGWRQAHLLSSPTLAPSRFAHEVVRRALITEAVARPLQFDRGAPKCTKEGRGKRRQAQAKAQGKAPAPAPASHGIKEYFLAPPEERKETGDGDSPAGTLFRDTEEDAPMPLSIRPPRRSYERPWNRKLKKVVGGGLCLDSSDEEGEKDKGEQEEGVAVQEEKAKVSKVHQQRAVARRRAKAANQENQLDQWASQINSQFNEVEDFELCLV